MEFVTAYGPKVKVSVMFHDEEGNHDGRTEQSHKETTLVQNIIKRFDKTGVLDHVARGSGQYGDFTSSIDEYHDALNFVIKAQDSFEGIPSDIRKRFGNDPGKFFEFVTNPDNSDELVKMGLAIAPEGAIEAQKVPMSSEPDSSASETN